MSGPGRPAAIFDLDGTLIAGTSAERLLVPWLVRQGVIGARQLASAALLAAALPVVGRTRALRRNKRWIGGVAVEAVASRMDRFLDEVVAPRWCRLVLDRMEELRAGGVAPYLLSGAPDFIVEAVGARLGVEAVVSTPMEVVGGRYSGRLGGVHCFADERHDLMSQETHAGQWIAFRQPVQRVALERMGRPVRHTWESNPGEVWEENEFWIELSARMDPDGELGVRKHFESPYRPGELVTVEEYYRWIFENSVPGLPVAAAEKGLTPAGIHAEGRRLRGGAGELHALRGGWLRHPSRKLEFFSPTPREWGCGNALACLAGLVFGDWDVGHDCLGWSAKDDDHRGPGQAQSSDGSSAVNQPNG